MGLFSRFFLFILLRWCIKGSFPKTIKKYVVIAAPHTSWIDVPLGLLVRSITKTHINFIGKSALFKRPQGFFFRWIGGFPIDRSKSNNYVQLLVQKFRENDTFILGLSPEGTRKKVDTWKTGYYFIAKEAGVPIVKVALDFKNKQILIDEPFYPTKNSHEDMVKIQRFYHGISGRFPELS